MQDFRVSSSVIVTETKIQGILTSKDILMRVMAPNLSPDTTLVEKVVMVLFSEVMTPNPQLATLETTIIDALHMMHDGKFLHLPVVDKDGNVVACVDVLQISHAAISLVENSSAGNVNNDVAGTIMQKFWDSAFSLEPPEDYDTNSEISGQLTLDGADTTKSTYQSAGFGNSYSFKFEDRTGQVHRFNCGSEHQEELVSAVMQRIGATNDGERPTVMYEDDEGDKIIIATNNDLAAAVSYARSAGLKALKLNLKFADSPKQTRSNTGTATEQKTSVVSYRTGIFAGAVALTSIGILVYLKRANQ
ncbi:CBS domain-containing protein cbscbspb3-like [Trifolium pratense]|uniref:CBS domain-containing protein cbscbspb3-like n=1 Tax=Trifolium pratense TaxID=57577 RepID=A0A2K3P8H6_TRIPR|nr:CBS domain-containing protein cbscbspb3-like [Trifolium pratense]